MYCHMLGDFRRGFGMEIIFIDHFNTQLVNTINYIAIFHIFQITTAHAKSFLVCCLFTSRSLVTALTVGVIQPHRPSFLFTDSFYKWLLIPQPVSVITSRHGPCRKYRSFLYFSRFRGNVFVCEGVTR
jgi:hypothetical protein